MTNLAYLPLYPKDFLGATGRLNAEKFGVYARLLFTSWFEPLNDDLDELSFLAGSSRKITKQILERYFTLEDGIWKNHRLEREREKANIKHQKAVESGKKGAEIRWGDDSNPNSPPNRNPNSRDLSKTIATHNPSIIYNNISETITKALSDKNLIYQKIDIPKKLENVYQTYGKTALLYIINKILDFKQAQQQQQPNYVHTVIENETPILIQIKAGAFDEHGQKLVVDDMPRITR